MTGFLRSSLRVRLLILVLLALLPAFAVALCTAGEEHARENAEVEENIFRLARLSAANHARSIEGARQLLASLARLSSAQELTAEQCSALAASLLREHDRYANLGFTTVDGDVICSAVPISGPVNIADRGYFQQALLSRDFAVGDHQVSRTTGRESLNFGYPVFTEPGSVGGVIFIALDLAWLNGIGTDEDLPDGAVLTIVDRTGAVIYHSVDPQGRVGRPFPEPTVLETILRRWESVIQARDSDGVSRLHAFVPLRAAAGGGGFVIVSMPTINAYAEANTIFTHQLTVLAAVAALALAVVWIGVELFLLRWIRAFVRATNHLGKGDLHARSGVRHDAGEMGRLARAFDEMASTLEAREADADRTTAALRANEERLRRIIETMADGLLIVDRDGRFTLANDTAAALLGLPREEITGLEAAAAPWKLLTVEGEPLSAEHRAFARVRRTGEPVHDVEYMVERADGTRVIVCANAAPLRDSANNLTGVFASLVDITDRKHAENAVRRQNAYLAALHDTALALINRLDVDDLLETILTRAAALMGSEHGFVFLPTGDGEALEVRFGLGVFGDLIGYRSLRGRGITGKVWERGEPVVVDEYDAWVGRSSAFPPGIFQAGVGVPLTSAGATVGVLGMLHVERGRRFTDEDVQLLGRFAQLASLALDNARLYTAAQQELDERTRTEMALRRAEEHLRMVVGNAPVVIFALDADGVFTLSEGRGLAALGLEADAVVGFSIFDVYQHVPQVQEQVRRALAGETFTTTLDRGGIIFDTRYVPVRDAEGRVSGVIGVATDVTDRRLLEEELQRQAFADALTGLANRPLFMDRLARALARTEREQTQVAVLFLDLDRFKVVNDSLGHAAGDALLATVAQRIQGCLRPGDIAARFGGDEFTILLEAIDEPDSPHMLATRIIEAVKAPVSQGGRELVVTASIGIATGDAPQVGPEELMREADIALYEAKAAGGGVAVRFDAAMSARAVERLEMESDLRHAIEHGELRLHYQPEVDSLDGRITGMEALVRWQHPRRGLLPPAQFIPLAEETGLVVPLGRWVLEEACRQARIWQTLRPVEEPLVMSVNLAARQIQQSMIVDDVMEVLLKTGIDPTLLRLEITESAVMEDLEGSIATLQALKMLGVRLAIDDFGTGYSSLSYLRQFPVDTLKVDRSFVQEMPRDEGTVAIVQAVTALAHALGMTVTAEGIETEDHYSHVRAAACDHSQGYYFARPVPPALMEALLVGAVTLPMRSVLEHAA